MTSIQGSQYSKVDTIRDTTKAHLFSPHTKNMASQGKRTKLSVLPPLIVREHHVYNIV